MSQVEHNNLITAIQQDNLSLFSANCKGNLNLRFGRFPLLTLCYMYRARKILSKYKKELWQVKDYVATKEPFDCYNKFKDLAGRTLRLFTNEKAIVTPIEILAILHKDNEVKKLYRKFKHTLLDKVKKNLKAIYTIYAQEPYILTYKIKLKPRKLTHHERLPYRIGISCGLAFVTIFTAILLTLNFTTGLGTTNNPYKIYTTKQLVSALNSEAHYILTKDFELDSSELNTEVKCVIDGNGYTLHINDILSTALIGTNKGTIKNLNVVYPATTKIINTSVSLFVKHNKGTLSNINITSGTLNLNTQKTTLENIYITGVANTNSGLIDNCSVQFVANITTTGNGECFVSGIAGDNSGTIKNTSFLASSSITTNEADISGIAINNELNGKINNCKNYSQITQTSEVDEWSPTIAGITLTNYGTIDSSSNFGELTISSTNDRENAQGNIFVGGIVANNFGSLTKCLNKGNINSTSKRIISYAGGVVAYSSYWIENNTTPHYPVLNNCGATGTLNVTSENEKGYAFVGGIGGHFQYGDLIDCFSLSDFTTLANEEKYFFGLLLGSSYVEADFFGYTYIQVAPNNNYVAYSDYAEHQLGALINGSSIIPTPTNLDQGVTTTTEEIIKTQGVYFDE